MRLSLSQTPSNTPSNTPTITPSASNCPIFTETIYSQVLWCDGDETEPIGNYNISLTYNGNTYPYTQFSGNTFLDTLCLDEVAYPSSGLTYSFVCNIPDELEFCEVNQPAFDRVDFIVGQFIGSVPGIPEIIYWTGQTIYYLNNVPVSSGNPISDIVSYIPISTPGYEPYNGCYYTLLFNDMVFGPQFEIRKKVVVTSTPTMTPTNTATPTITASPTATLNITPTMTPSNTATMTPTNTVTQTNTSTPTNTLTPSNTSTPTNTATSTNTATPTNTPTITPTNTTTTTPSATSAACPTTAYYILEPTSANTALSSYFIAVGSPGFFRGMSNGFTFSTSLPIYQTQVNNYISYTGWGVSTLSIESGSMSFNQDPLNYTNTQNIINNTWFSALIPSCNICSGGLYDSSTLGINTTIRGLEFYYSGNSIPKGYYRLYTSYTNSTSRVNTNTNLNLSVLICPTSTPTPTLTRTPSATPTTTQTNTQTNTPTNTGTQTSTPTNTPTPTRTPEITPSMTQTNTSTPTPTPPIDYCSYVVINTSPSLDIPIYDVYVNGVQVVYSSGGNWTITPSNSPGTFTTSQTGATQTVAVYYGANIPGQRIEILDCNEATQCQNINPGGGIATFTDVAVSCGCYWSINGYDGTC